MLQTAQAAELENILTTLPVALVGIDQVGNVVVLNNAAEVLFGQTSGRIVGKSIGELMQLNDAREPIYGLRNGQAFPIETAISTMTVHNATLTLFVVRDITDQQSQLQEQQRVARLQIAEEHVDVASRIKDVFLAIVSQELRNPLGSIQGWVHVLQTRLEDGRIDASVFRHGFDVIRSSIDVQTRLINDLVDTSRIVGGLLQLDMTEIDLRALVELTLEKLQPLAEEKGVFMQGTLTEGEQFITGDPARLQQILWNVLSNAIKFTPRGGTVEIRVERQDGFAQIIVQDNGQGINASFLPYIFERFTQADYSPSRVHGGLGLGLAIAKSLVEHHHGTIQALSAGEGKGSTFVIRFPLHMPDDAQKQSDKARLEIKSLAGIHVLVVEDHADTRMVIKLLLEGHDVRVTDVDSATAALSVLKEEIPDLIISDIGMPHEDGYSLMRKIRAGGITVPALALTAHSHAEDRIRALNAGFHFHIPKPVDPEELVVMISILMGKK